ncbi:MAG: Dabb family protein [Myxococcota bacterium]
MLIHTVYVQLTEDHRTDKRRRSVADEARVRLSQMPWVRGVHAAVPLEPASAKGWDLALHLQFDNAEGLAAFEKEPEFLAWHDQELGPKRSFEKRWTWDLV